MASVMELYTNMIKQGWSLSEIDRMDILFYFRLIRHMGEKKNQTVPVDEIGWL